MQSRVQGNRKTRDIPGPPLTGPVSRSRCPPWGPEANEDQVRFSRARLGAVERLLWSRDGRLVTSISKALPHARVMEIADSGWCVLAGANELTEAVVLPLAQASAYGLADVDPGPPASER